MITMIYMLADTYMMDVMVVAYTYCTYVYKHMYMYAVCIIYSSALYIYNALNLEVVFVILSINIHNGLT